MAHTWRFYLASRIGRGTHKEPFRAKIYDHIPNTANGFDWHNWKQQDRTDRYLCLVDCDPGVHDKLDADASIEAVSPQFETKLDARAWLASKSDNELKLHGPRSMIGDVLRG